MKTLVTHLLAAGAALSIAGCVSTPPELQTGAQCVRTKGGLAHVTADAVEHVATQENRLTRNAFRNLADMVKARQIAAGSPKP